MSLQSARFASLDVASMEATNTDDFGVKLNGTGDIQKAAANAGLELKPTLAGAYTFTTLPQSAATPTAANDFVNKSYADGLLAGLTWKDNVRALADANQTLTGLPTVDGVTLAAGERILLIAQTTASQNGIWEVNGGAWTRPSDFPAAGSATSAVTVVDEGTTYADTIYRQTAEAPTIDTSNQTWVDLPVVAKTAGAGLTDAANTFNVVATDASLTVNPNDMQVNLSAAGAILEVAADGIRLAAGALGDGLTGGGAAVASVQVADASIAVGATGINVNPAALIEGGAQQIDGDQINITATIPNITPNTTPAEVTTATQLTSVLVGLGDAVGAAGHNVVSITLSAAQAAANSITAIAPQITAIEDCWLQPDRGNSFPHGTGSVSFVAGAAGAGSVSWTGSVLQGVLAAGDIVHLYCK